MSDFISKRVATVPASQTMAISTLAKQLSKDGHDVINLGVGEPDLPTPAPIIEATKKALEQGATKYTPVGGIPELKSALQAYAKKHYGTELAANQVLVSCGAKHSLFNAFVTLLNEGDEVIIPTPCWVSYIPMLMLLGAQAVEVSTTSDQGFRIDPEALLSKIGPKTKAIVLNSPSNPTGAVQRQDDLNMIISEATSKGIFVITDDIYDRMVFDDATWTSPYRAPGADADYIIAINSVSKTYAMTGYRIGTTFARSEIIQKMQIVQSQSTSCPNAAAQWATIAALECDPSYVESMRKTFENRRNSMLPALRKIEGVQVADVHGAFYAFPNFSAKLNQVGLTSNDFAKRLIEEAHVAVVPGEAFQAPGHVRISFVQPEARLIEATERIAAFLQKLS